MKTVIENGDLVYSHQNKMQGKVKRVRIHDKSAAVEFILCQNRDLQIRTTQLHILKLSDLEKVERKR
ncbi:MULTISPECIES: hypothetical protein [Cytobacillus]|uniref:hypothetical protein n=1 Tax=Cytobacillus TaxID=2675230 RepID=UPI002040E3BC|nr:MULTISPECIES: hypothetical protein [Cytobacillus]MCM3394845.1 hypothetical protein [Cytobacillus oceanisediminis]UQX56076.1 hypothetical protein M5V91_10845 [Cytobacillus pseudoceanisediminis]